jgi:hypothetical protein
VAGAVLKCRAERHTRRGRLGSPDRRSQIRTFQHRLDRELWSGVELSEHSERVARRQASPELGEIACVERFENARDDLELGIAGRWFMSE